MKAPNEAHGLVADPEFVDSTNMDFRLQPTSAFIDAGTNVQDFTQWYVGSGPDLGAYEDGRLTWCRPFRYQDPPGVATYSESPRIVRCFAYGQKLAVFFSTDIFAGGVTPADIQLSTNGHSVVVEAVRFPMPARVLRLDLGDAIAHGQAITLSFSQLPIGLNNQTATMWGADLEVVGIPISATLLDEMARAGMPVPALMKLLGHKTPKMTMRYVEVVQTDVRQAYDQALTQLSVIRSVQARTLPTLPVPSP